jgi:hypothetical protein
MRPRILVKIFRADRVATSSHLEKIGVQVSTRCQCPMKTEFDGGKRARREPIYPWKALILQKKLRPSKLGHI